MHCIQKFNLEAKVESKIHEIDLMLAKLNQFYAFWIHPTVHSSSVFVNPGSLSPKEK